MNTILSSLFPRLRRPEALRETAPTSTVQAAKLLGMDAGRDPALYERALGDAMVATALNVKRLGVLAAPWRIEPNGPSPAARRNADFAAMAMDRMRGSANGILGAAMDAFGRGLSVQELVFAPEGGKILLVEARPKDPSLFRLDLDAFGRLRGLVLAAPGERERALPLGKFALWAYRADYARPRGRSDLDAVAPHLEAKRTLSAAWRLHLERFASPTVLGKFKPGASDEDRAAMLGSLQGLARSTAIVYPEEFEIDTLAASPAGSTGFMEAIEFHDRQIARAILGQTLATDEGRRVGSLAMGRVHLQVLVMQLVSLRRELADRVMGEGVFRPLIELNFGPVGPANPVPRFVFEEPAAGAFVTGEV